jgi:hypothetical protein
MRMFIYAPLIIFKLFLVIRRERFVTRYQPSSEVRRNAEHVVRNVARRADYEAKKLLWGRRNDLL